MKVMKKVYKFATGLLIMAIVISGSFLGITIAMNLFTGLTLIIAILLLFGHLGVKKTVEENPNVATEHSKKLWGGKLMAVQYTVIFVCLAGSAHWILFFTWLTILFASLSLDIRYKEALEESKADKHEDVHTKVSDIIEKVKDVRMTR